MQQQVAADILATFPALEPDDVTSRSSSAPGTDVLLSPAAQALFPYSIECKNVEALNVWGAFKQALANSKPSLPPLLVIARNRQEPLVVLRWSDFLTCLKVNAVL